MAKILVIEDEEPLRILIKKMLTLDGHQVFMAENGIEGVNNYYQLKPDIVITDVVMPKKNGIEVIEELLSFNPKLPIIAMSGGRRANNSIVNIDSFDLRGLKGFLRKPFAHQQLQDVIKIVLPV